MPAVRAADNHSATRLVCVECGRQAPPDASGWKAELADDPRDDEPAEVAVYCPRCWRGSLATKPTKAD
jgi:hypothetical protein